MPTRSARKVFVLGEEMGGLKQSGWIRARMGRGGVEINFQIVNVLLL